MIVYLPIKENSQRVPRKKLQRIMNKIRHLKGRGKGKRIWNKVKYGRVEE